VSRLVSTVPGAFAAFYSLLAAAGQAQNPPISVFAQALQQDEPNSYVLLGGSPDGQPGIRNHSFEPASLGSLNQYETFELWGYATAYLGSFDPASALADTWSLYQDVVMATFVNYSGGNGSLGGPGSAILGASAPATLERMLPECADYTGVPTGSGFAGVVEFCYSFKSRITVA